MDYSSVLAHLQSQFAGKLVLYVDDIAMVLGMSNKAISDLIAGNELPFNVKTLAGARCVDIFQVAQWLSSNAEMSAQVADHNWAVLTDSVGFELPGL